MVLITNIKLPVVNNLVQIYTLVLDTSVLAIKQICAIS